MIPISCKVRAVAEYRVNQDPVELVVNRLHKDCGVEKHVEHFEALRIVSRWAWELRRRISTGDKRIEALCRSARLLSRKGGRRHFSRPIKSTL
jgi:hypothetical protein